MKRRYIDKLSRDSRLAELVEKYQIGYVADSGSAFSHIIREILPEQIREKCENEKKLQDAVKSVFLQKRFFNRRYTGYLWKNYEINQNEYDFRYT